MSNEVELISDDTLVPIRCLGDTDTGYILSTSGRSRRLVQGVTMKVKASELRELYFQPGGAVLIQNYIHVGNKQLALELGVPEDSYDHEYSWTAADVAKCLTEYNIDVLLDALDYAPYGIVDFLKDKAIELEIPDNSKIQAITKKTGVDIAAAIRNKHAYDNPDSDSNVSAPSGRRAEKATVTRTRRVR